MTEEPAQNEESKPLDDVSPTDQAPDSAPVIEETPEAEPEPEIEEDTLDTEPEPEVEEDTLDPEPEPEVAEAAPEPEAKPEENVSPVEGDERMEGPRERLVPWWPFVSYVAVWLVFSAAVVYFLTLTPPGSSIYDNPLYEYLLYTGVALTAAGPLVALGVWFAGRMSKGPKSGRLATAMLAGAVATTVGVMMWWVALLVLDYLRLGRFL